MNKYTIASINIVPNTTYAVSDFVKPAPISSFNRDIFWDEFVKKHIIQTEEELIEILIDLSRCHFSPKIENWPGLKITIKNPDIEVILVAGKSKFLKPFERKRGSLYNWTAACLATSAIYHQIFVPHIINHKDDGPNGHVDGLTQFCTTLDGFTANEYDNCVKAFETWLTSVGCKKRDAEVSKKIHAAAHRSIGNRTKDNSAFSLLSAIKYLTGKKYDPGDQHSK